MRKIYTIMILMFLVFGISSVIAQNNPTEEIIAVSSGSSSGPLVSVHNTEEIASITAATQPTVSSSEGLWENDIQVSTVTEVTSTSSGGGSGFSISSYAHGRCAIGEEKLNKLHRLVTQIRELSEIEDKEKYYELDMQIRKLSQEIKEEKQRCLETEGLTQEVATSQPIIEKLKTGEVKLVKPVIVEDATEITEYYKKKMDRIIASEEEANNKIYKLKELRTEIDKLIESLLKNKDEIKLEEISSIVETVQIKPGEIKADNVIINTINKKIIIKVNKKDLKIMPTETQVIIQDENLEIKAMELNIKNGVLKVGDSEVQLTASDIVKKFKVEPKEIELKEENSKAIYKIKVEEDRKLFGFISVKVEKDLTIDAINLKAEIVKEKYPWWAFMTTKIGEKE